MNPSINSAGLPASVAWGLIDLVPMMIADTAALVHIPSVVDEKRVEPPYEDVVNRALGAAVDVAKKVGCHHTILDLDGGFAMARIGETANPEFRVTIPIHTDVVSGGEPGDWQTGDPFRPVVRMESNGTVVLSGRGTQDNKRPGVIATYSAAMLQNLIRPGALIDLLFVGEEERAGWSGVSNYLSKYGKPNVSIVPDSEFTYSEELPIVFVRATGVGLPLPEEARGNIELVSASTGKNDINKVPARIDMTFDAASRAELEALRTRFGERIGTRARFSEITDTGAKGYRIEVAVKGKDGHAAEPWESGGSINAVQLAIWALEGVRMKDTPAARAVHFVREQVGYDSAGTAFGFASTDPMSQGVHTLNVGIFRPVEGHPAGAYFLGLDTRVRKGLDAQAVLEKLVGITTAAGFAIADPKTDTRLIPPVSPAGTSLAGVLDGAWTKWTGLPPYSRISGGGTFARLLSNPADGMIAAVFGMSFPDGPKTEHHADESFEFWPRGALGALLYADALWRLVGDPSLAEEAADVGAVKARLEAPMFADMHGFHHHAGQLVPPETGYDDRRRTGTNLVSPRLNLSLPQPTEPIDHAAWVKRNVSTRI